jgi:hypothetical protein
MGQRSQWDNGQPASVVSQYATTPAVPTQYPVPGALPQYGSVPAPYGPPAVAHQYQQYPVSTPPVQAYQPPQASYRQNSQQYRLAGAPAPYAQPPAQAHNAPPQYGNPGYQGPPQNQYPQSNGPPQPQYASGYQNPHQQYSTPPVPLYQPPPNTYQPQNGSFAGASPSQSHSPQWNGGTPALPFAGSFPPSNNSQYGTGYDREYSGPPRQQSVSSSIQTPNQNPQQNLRPESHHATPQTPTSYPGPSHASETPADQSVQADEPNALSAPSSSSLPHPRRESSSSSQQMQSMHSATSSTKTVEEPDTNMKDGAQHEDGELTEEDIEDQEFIFDFETIFYEQSIRENVRLAQPLSTTWESTPVPLLDERLNNSVSRYARKENLKDFMRPIRSQPQWDYLKEDPAFSDSTIEGDSIPLDEVPAWMAARQGTEVVEPRPSILSRKRPRSAEQDENEQDNVYSQIKQEGAIEVLDPGMPNKRQKNDGHAEEETLIIPTASTPTGGPRTPTLGRSGTPSLDADDDVWAPQPGEGVASALQDPTEVLLASLGVSGSPKPVTARRGSLPPQTTDESSDSPPTSISPQANQPPTAYNMPPRSNSAYDNSYEMSQQYNSNAPYSAPPQGQYTNAGPPQGHPPYSAIPHGQYGGPVQGNSYANQPYNFPRQGPYDNGVPPQGNASYLNQQYGMPRQNSYGNGPPPQNNPQYNAQPYEMPRQNSYGNEMPHHIASPYANQPNGLPQQQYPPPNQYGPVIHQQNAAYSGPPQNNPQYSNGPYGMPSQQYSPANQYNDGMQHGISPQNNGPYPRPHGPQGTSNTGYAPNAMPQRGYPAHQPYNNGQVYQPPRQDSGYFSARESYSNGSGTNHGLPSMPPQIQQRQQTTQQSPAPEQVDLDGSNDTPPPKPMKVEAEETNFFASLPSQFPRKDKVKTAKVRLEVKTEGANNATKQEDEKDDSPLTPTSMEILGKLLPTYDSNGKKIDRKPKRPQPVVEAAYRY